MLKIGRYKSRKDVIILREMGQLLSLFQIHKCEFESFLEMYNTSRIVEKRVF